MTVETIEGIPATGRESPEDMDTVARFDYFGFRDPDQTGAYVGYVPMGSDYEVDAYVFYTNPDGSVDLLIVDIETDARAKDGEEHFLVPWSEFPHEGHWNW